MTRTDRATPPMDPTRTPAGGLAPKLDPLVASARAVLLLDCLGRIAVAAAVGLVVVLLARAAGMPLPAPAAAALIVGGIATAAWRSARRWRWPDRLSTAMEIERKHPWMGERISRAVGLETAGGGPTGLPGSMLAADAVAEAIAVLEGRPPARPLDRLAAFRWPLAGVVACGLSLLAMRPDGRDGGIRPTMTTATGDSPAAPAGKGLSDAGLASARRLADDAATGERAAAALLERFAAAPGLRRDAVPRQDRERLDATAAALEGIAEAMGRDLRIVAAELSEGGSVAEGKTSRILSGLVGEGHVDRTGRLRDAAEPIRGNRTAEASRAIRREVGPILGALESLGVRPSVGISRETGMPEASRQGPLDRAGLDRRRLLALIEPAAATGATGEMPAEERQETAEGSARATSDRAEIASRPPGSTSPGASGGAGGAEAPERPGTAAGSEPGDGDGRPPAWIRGREQLPAETLFGDALGIPERYRHAVDLYYLRLWKAESAADDDRDEGRGPR